VKHKDPENDRKKSKIKKRKEISKSDDEDRVLRGVGEVEWCRSGLKVSIPSPPPPKKKI